MASQVSRASSRTRSATSPFSILYRYFVTHYKMILNLVYRMTTVSVFHATPRLFVQHVAAKAGRLKLVVLTSEWKITVCSLCLCFT